MSFNRELKTHLENFLDREFAQKREHIIDGSCKDMTDYGRRCGELSMIRLMIEEIADWQSKMNDDAAGISIEE